MIRRVVGIHFSPLGGTAGMTRLLTKEIASRLQENSIADISTQTFELLGTGPEHVNLDDETVVVIGVPVYVGKVPLPAVRALDKFSANGAVAVAAVSYGARSYGNALYELQHCAEAHGFKVIGAGAFSADRRRYGDGPGEYAGDRDTVVAFSKAAAAKIMRLSGSEIEGLKIKPAPLEVAGHLPVHLTSRVSPRAAAAAQRVLERVCVRRKASEWFL